MKEAVWIVGRGLLGSGIESRIRTENPEATIFEAPRFSWNDPEKISAEFSASVTAFGECAKTCGRYRIFWTAGRGIMSSSDEDMHKETENLRKFLDILNSDARINAVPGVLGFSSSAGGVYGGSIEDVISETSAIAPNTAYGRGKVDQETLIKAAANPLRGVLIARISNLYGPGQSRTKKQGLLTHIARCMLVRKPIHIFVPFDTMRDYLHASDCAVDFVNTTALMHPGETVTKIIASEEPATIATIVGHFRRITRQTPLLVTGTTALAAAYPHRMRFSSGVLKNARGTQRIGLLEGIAETFSHERMQYAESGIPA